MPQMAPLYWLSMFIFFLILLFLFMMMNYFILPFNKINSFNFNQPNKFKSWKL